MINGGLLCTGPWADNPPGDEGELGGLGRFRLGFACPFFYVFLLRAMANYEAHKAMGFLF
jgi:hypothetical protein